MSKEDDEQVEDTTVEQEVEQEVELDKAVDVQGDLVENPALEVEDEPIEESEETDDVRTDQGDSESTDAGDPEDTDATTGETETTNDAEVAVEKDETGVYEPVTATDPGAFQPEGDYSFEVTTAEGKTVKISTPEEADAFAQRLDSEENLLTAYQFTMFNRNFLKMDSGIDRERVDYEKQKEAFEIQSRQEQIRNEQVTQWSNEINYLAAKGLIPEITQEQNATNWTDPKNADVPAIKERLAIFQWMETENNARRNAGIAEVTSAVDAFRMMTSEAQTSVEKEEKQTEVSSRQAKGKMVTGASSFTPSNEQANSIVGEGGSLQDLVHEFSASM